MDQTPFHIFGPSHWGILILSVGLVIAGLRVFRQGSERMQHYARFALAGILFAAVLADPPITFLRYRSDSEGLAWKLVQETAWPFYLCDWAAIFCGLALCLRHQRLAELGWCWGMGGTMQGLLYPASLSYDWPNPDFIAFFAEHAGVPIAGTWLVFGMGLRPAAGVVWRAWIWLFGYFCLAGLLNAALIHWGGFPQANYGFVCSSDYSPFALLGPWPWYNLVEWLLLGGMFTVLTVLLIGWSAVDWKQLRPWLRRREVAAHPTDLR
jgi:hypothetical integral membrane protein (TIGR02206 family)